MVQFQNAITYCNRIILEKFQERDIKAWLAGGALRDYFMGQAVKGDFDIFFPSEEEYLKALAFFKKEKSVELHKSPNSDSFQFEGRKFDLVHKHYFPDPQTTIEVFDFTVCMLACDGLRVYYGPSTFIDLAKRQLIFNKDRKFQNPASSMSRAFKYYKKGFYMCVGEQRVLLEAIQKEARENLETPTNASALLLSDYELFRGLD